MSKAKRWKRSIRRARWKTYKKELLAKGWVEVYENTFVTKSQAIDYPPYIPTHLGGKAEKGQKVRPPRHLPYPPRGEIRKLKKYLKSKRITLRQWFSGQC